MSYYNSYYSVLMFFYSLKRPLKLALNKKKQSTESVNKCLHAYALQKDKLNKRFSCAS